MKKNRVSKLTLHRETVRAMGSAALYRVVGGTMGSDCSGVSGCLECPPPTDYTCQSCWYTDCSCTACDC